MKYGLNRHGLTLVETLVAGMILSATVVTVSALISKSMFGTGTNRAYELAASLLDRQMTLIDTVGIDAFIEAGQTQGEFGEIAPNHTWAMYIEALGIDNRTMIFFNLITSPSTWLTVSMISWRTFCAFR